MLAAVKTAAYKFGDIMIFLFPYKSNILELTIPLYILSQTPIKSLLKIFTLYQIKVANGMETLTANFNKMFLKEKSNSDIKRK